MLAAVSLAQRLGASQSLRARSCRMNPAFRGLGRPTSVEAGVPAATGTPHLCGSGLRRKLAGVAFRARLSGMPVRMKSARGLEQSRTLARKVAATVVLIGVGLRVIGSHASARPVAW